MSASWKMVMEKVFFISDIHIGAGTRTEELNKLDRLTSFFEYINHHGNQLFIVGDLFDFWFEYRNVVTKRYFPVLFQIHKLIKNGVIVHFLPGNHDSWTKKFFSDQIEMKMHPETMESEIQQKKLLIFHGDGIFKKDVGYRILKKIFRNPINIFLYRLLHPDIGIPFAKLMATGSRKHTAGKEFDDEPDYMNFATEKFKQGFDYVIVGHSHKPLLKKVDHHILLNLGDWIQHFSYGKLEQGILTLNYWNR
jgi:UDP-2,3-diacylglucosamine hydrolase